MTTTTRSSPQGRALNRTCTASDLEVGKPLLQRRLKLCRHPFRPAVEKMAVGARSVPSIAPASDRDHRLAPFSENRATGSTTRAASRRASRSSRVVDIPQLRIPPAFHDAMHIGEKRVMLLAPLISAT